MVDTQRKTPSIVIEQIRAAILDKMYKPGERLMEADVATQFKVSRSPVREALQALESEGTLVATPYAGAMVRPLSPAEACEIAEIRLGLISLTLKPAHPLVLTWPMTWQSESPLPKAPGKPLNATAVFGTSSLRRLSSSFSGKCSGNWTIV